MMFVIQVKTGCEASAAATLTRLGFNIKAPQKVMRIRKGGVWKHEVKPVFPGYIFLEADTYIEAAGYYKVKKTFCSCDFPPSLDLLCWRAAVRLLASLLDTTLIAVRTSTMSSSARAS